MFTQAAQQPAPIPEVNALPFFPLAGPRTRAFDLDLVFFCEGQKGKRGGSNNSSSGSNNSSGGSNNSSNNGNNKAGSRQQGKDAGEGEGERERGEPPAQHLMPGQPC